MNKQQIEQMAELTKRPEDIVEDIIWHYCKGLMSTDDEQAEKTIKIFAPFLVEWAKENFGQDAGKESEGEAAKCIQDIEILFPADCQYPDTAAIGKELLLLAMESAGFNWRKLPAEVLQQYRMLCKASLIHPQKIKK